MVKIKQSGIKEGQRTEKIVSFPNEILQLLKRATLEESHMRGSTIPATEFIIRATIDRIGTVLGEPYADDIYRRYFNGVVQLPSEGEMDESEADIKL